MVFNIINKLYVCISRIIHIRDHFIVIAAEKHFYRQTQARLLATVSLRDARHPKSITSHCRLVRRRLLAPPSWCFGSGPWYHRSCNGHSFARLSAISFHLQFPWERIHTHLGGWMYKNENVFSWHVNSHGTAAKNCNLELSQGLKYWMGLVTCTPGYSHHPPLTFCSTSHTLLQLQRTVTPLAVLPSCCLLSNFKQSAQNLILKSKLSFNYFYYLKWTHFRTLCSQCIIRFSSYLWTPAWEN